MTEPHAPGSPTNANAIPSAPHLPKTPQFPAHNAPRVWLLTNGASPVSIQLARQLLDHGDYIVTAVSPADIDKDDIRAKSFHDFLGEISAQGLRYRGGSGGAGDAPEGELDAGRAGHVDDMVVDGGHFDGDGEDGAGKAGSRSHRAKMKPWGERFRMVPLATNSVSLAQAAIAQSLATFNMGIDIMLITTPSIVLGTVEELGQTASSQVAVREQFENNFFLNTNLIKAVLPSMRERKNGHIILLTSVAGHLGTPGLAAHCASVWAMEGYCDSLAFEVAPFNIKTTIVQPNIEVSTMTNTLTSVPPMSEYSPEHNHAPCQRDIIAGILDRLEGVEPSREHSASRRSEPLATSRPTSGIATQDGTPDLAGSDQESDEDDLTTGDALFSPTVTSIFPPLVPSMQRALVAETVFAIAAIGGHDNPPARHIVGYEGIIAVKEKLKTNSEELEDFVEASVTVDFASETRDTVP